MAAKGPVRTSQLIQQVCVCAVFVYCLFVCVCVCAHMQIYNVATAFTLVVCVITTHDILIHTLLRYECSY